ncbi:MAG: hypothetical protein JWR02_365 [Mucilaginibacter sp.]|nr:hypothetical protein [Mucilaginibacter sp.]
MKNGIRYRGSTRQTPKMQALQADHIFIRSARLAAERSPGIPAITIAVAIKVIFPFLQHPANC